MTEYMKVYLSRDEVAFIMAELAGNVLAERNAGGRIVRGEIKRLYNRKLLALNMMIQSVGLTQSDLDFWGIRLVDTDTGKALVGGCIW